MIVRLVKESRPGEDRVALVPSDVQKLRAKHPSLRIEVERGAGSAAGFADSEYEAAGAIVCSSAAGAYEANTTLVRCKRAAPDVESAEIAQWSEPAQRPAVIIGALDALASDSEHLRTAAKEHGVELHALDQHQPLLSAMAELTAELALDDALQRAADLADGEHTIDVVILGAGGVGRTAAELAVLRKGVRVTLIGTRESQAVSGAKFVVVDRTTPIAEQQASVRAALPTQLSASKRLVLICAARRANERAPILVPATTLRSLQFAVVSDLALTEGGNVEGSEHDRTDTVGDHVVVTNTSGFPKKRPHEASKAWSAVTRDYLMDLLKK